MFYVPKIPRNLKKPQPIKAKKGIFSSKKKEILEKSPVISKMPTKRSKPPIIFSIKNICFLSFVNSTIDFEINNADRIKGIPSPTA